MFHGTLIRSALAALVATCVVTEVGAQTRPSLKACGSQIADRSVSGDREAETLVNDLASKLHEGDSSLFGELQPGHMLFCRDDGGTWLHIAPGKKGNKLIARRVAKVMAEMEEAARVLGLNSALATALKRRNLGAHASLVSVGKFKNGTAAAFSPYAGLLAVKETGDGLFRPDLLIHEGLDHWMFYLLCDNSNTSSCKGNTFSLAWKMVTEADAFTKQFAYAIYVKQTKYASELSENSLFNTTYDGMRFLQIAEDLLRANPNLKSRMLAEKKVPREFLVKLFEKLIARPPRFYFDVAAARHRPFGTDHDILAALANVKDYLDDADRKRIADILKSSRVFKALGGGTVNSDQVKSLLQGPHNFD
jgi:hypothetical protein